MNNILIYSHLMIWIFSIAMFIYRYRKSPQAFFLNYMFYILFFGLFYVSLPSIVSLITMYSWVGASSETIVETSIIGLYFIFIFMIGYIFSKDKNFVLSNLKIFPQKKIIYSIRIIGCILFLYLSFIYIINIDLIINALSNRPLQSDINAYLENTYKIKPLFIIQILFVLYLFLTTKNYKYLFLLIPYIIIDLSLSGRGYLLGIFILFFILRTMDNKMIKLKYIILSITAIAGISVLRTPGEFNILNYVQIFYEFIFTWMTTHLTYEHTRAQDFFSTINYSLMRLFPSIFYNILNGEYISYTKWAFEQNPLGWGLAGSIVSESISFKNNAVLIIYPILIVFYSYVMNFFFRKKMLSGIIVFILSLLYIQVMFRTSFFEIALYPFYLMLFFGIWIIGIDAITYKKRIKYGI